MPRFRLCGTEVNGKCGEKGPAFTRRRPRLVPRHPASDSVRDGFEGRGCPAPGPRAMTTRELPRMPDEQAPFWRRKAMSEMTQRRMGEPVRRLRPLLPQQADRRTTPTTHCSPTSAASCSTAQTCRCTRLCPPPGQGARLRAAHPAQCAAADLAAADLRLSPGGGGQGPRLVAPARLRRSARPCTRPASRCAGAWRRARRTCRTRSSRNISSAGRGNGRRGRRGGCRQRRGRPRDARARRFNGRSRGREQTINSL